jgi:hypothetical protein
MRGVVVVTLLGMLFGVMELAARLYVVHGLKMAGRDFTRFYRFDPALRLLAWETVIVAIRISATSTWGQ